MGGHQVGGGIVGPSVTFVPRSEGDPMTTVAVIFHSGSGQTEAQAEAVARGAESAGSKVLLLTAEQAAARLDELDIAHAVIFGSPTYLGSVSAQFKTFMDATSRVWSAQRWRDKLAAGFTSSGSPCGDKMATLVQMAVFAAQHGMIWVPLGLKPDEVPAGSPRSLNRLGSHLGAAAQSFRGPEDDAGAAESDRLTAEHLGRRVAALAARLADQG